MPNDPNLNAGAPSGTLATHVEQLAERFDAAWQAGRRPRIEEFLGEEKLAADPAGLRQMLLELVKLDLAWRWKGPLAETLSSKMASEQTAGGTGVFFPSRPKLEDYCRAYPALGPLDGLPDELIVAEYDARHRHGDKPSHEDYCRRWPAKAERLVELLRQADLALAAGPGKEALGETVALPAGAGLSLQPIVREQFLRNLEQSGLMTAAQAAAVLESVPSERTAEQDSADGRALAVRLVRAGRLTPYQAEQLCRGETGMLAFDEYVVLDRLGAGGMGEVLKAEHRSMGRLVAVKVLAPKLVDSPEAVKRFQREVRAAARLEHPNIVTAYDAREHAGRHCLIMQYVEGHDLGQIVKRQGPLPVAEAVDYVIQAARGLQFAHENGIVHRDIKPANLLLQTPSSSSGRATGRGGQKATVKILDMGLARLDDAAGGGEDDDQLTGSSQMMGTCDYMAPEQAVDTHNVDHRADIYALGCTLYRLVTGKRPYTGCTPVQVLMAHREAPIPSLREGRDDVSPQLEAVYQRMVAKKPEDRQRSMAEVIDELSACCVPEDEDDRPSDSALTAFLHEVAAQSTGTGLTRAVGVSSTAGAGGPPGTGGKLSSVAGVALSPAVSVARSLRPYLLVGGTVMVIAVLAALLAVALRPSKPSAAPGRGTLAFEGPLDQVRVVARHEQGTKLHELKLDGQGRVALGEGTYRLALARGYQQYRVVPDTVTITADEQVTVRIAPSGGETAPPLAVAPFDAAQAKHHQQAWADYVRLPVEFENSIGMKFVLVPPGEFMMGSTEEEVEQLLREAKQLKADQWLLDRLSAEAPQRRVRITRPYYLGVYEVTQAEYKGVTGGNPSAFSVKGKEAAKVAGLDTGRHPVGQVSWNDAKTFCEKLSAVPKEQVAGRLYRLPTEAQWEYACRAGTTTKWSWGDDAALLSGYAWCVANSGGRTHTVGEKKSNAFGLFDMHGNVWEWCADWLDDGQYATSPEDDPAGPPSGSFRVNRGGGWGCDARRCRLAGRDANTPEHRNDGLGFRIVSTIAQKAESPKSEMEHQALPAWTPGAPVERPKPVTLDLKPEPVTLKPGEPLSFVTLVANPAPLPGVRSWTIETIRHRGIVQSLAYSPDGSVLATGSYDGSVRLWDTVSGKLTRVLVGHDEWVQVVAWSPDGKLLASGNLVPRGLVCVWDAHSGTRLRRVVSSSGSIAWSPDGRELILASGVWDAAENSYRWKFDGQLAYSAAWSPDGKTVVRNGEGGALQLWDAQSGVLRDTLSSPESPGRVASLAWSPDSRLLACTSDSRTDNTVIWDVAARRIFRRLSTGGSGGNAVAWSPDGKRVAVVRSGATPLLVWDAADGKLLWQAKHDHCYGASVVFSPDSKTVSIGTDMPCKVLTYDASSGHAIHELPGVSAQSYHGAVAFTPDGTELAYANVTSVGRGLIRVWDLPKRQLRFEWQMGSDPGLRCLSYSPDGQTIALGVRQATFLLDRASGKLMHTLPMGVGQTRSGLFFSPDSKWIAISGDQTAAVYEVASGSLRCELPKAGQALGFSPDGRTLALRADGKNELHDAETGELSGTLPGSENPRSVLPWSPDGKTLADVSSDHRLCLWDIATKKGVGDSASLYESGRRDSLMRWLPDGPALLVAAPQQAWLCEAPSLKLIRTIPGYLFTSSPPDLYGHSLAFAGPASIRLRSLDTGEVLCTLLTLDDQGWAFLSPDGHYTGSPGVEKDFVYVVLTDFGEQLTLTPGEFAAKYGWKNDPAKVQLDGIAGVGTGDGIE